MRPSWFHLAKGTYPRQARIGLNGLHEEHVSRLGFVGSVAMLYHRRGATEFISVDPVLAPPPKSVDDLVAPDRDDPGALPLGLYENDDVLLSWSQRGAAHPFFVRNLDGDELFFVHAGSGVLETEFGPLTYGREDFLFVPKGVTYRLVPNERNALLVVESRSPLEPFTIEAAGRHAPFDPTVLEVPEPGPRPETGAGEYPIRYKLGGRHLAAVLKYDPFDVVGWKGDLFPFRLHMADILPIHSERSHLAPSIGGIFKGEGFVVANLLPQPAVADLGAEELPDYHRNVDYDEFWLIHEAGGPVRANGQLLFTPQGMVHGATEEVREKHQANRQPGDRRQLTAVGIDTRRHLQPTAEYLEQLRKATS
jgi:homogentisate 1,2-dioxygenase